jgi:hypothetical protein
MAAHGEITPMPRCAVFADTGWEPKAVYDWLEWLKGSLPFPVHTVSAGNIRSDQVNARMRGYAEAGERWASLPYFTLADGAKDAKSERGMVRRQCTNEYKIEPIERFLRTEILRLKPRQRAPKEPVITQWRGISADEAQRMKPSREMWYEVRYPLAMEKNMTRGDCLAWMEKRLYPKPPRSACIGCPFHSDQEWLAMRKDRPAEFAEAVEFDAAIRKAGGTRGDTFLHSTCKPLGEIDFEHRVTGGHADLWGEECEGMCGV